MESHAAWSHVGVTSPFPSSPASPSRPKSLPTTLRVLLAASTACLTHATAAHTPLYGTAAGALSRAAGGGDAPAGELSFSSDALLALRALGKQLDEGVSHAPLPARTPQYVPLPHTPPAATHL
eukprot:COSAG01_NODE_676_length_14324_cov_17.420105_18_plen_123_part_00